MRRWLIACSAVLVLLGATTWSVSEEEMEVRKAVEGWFAALPARLPDGDTSVRDGSIVYRLSGEGGGTWGVRLLDGKLTVGEGELETATAVLECSAADFAAMMQGKLVPEVAYFTGRLRIQGDMAYLMAFHMKLPPPGASASAPAEGVTTDTAGWYVFDARRLDGSEESAADASDLLDAPAGKHGFLTVRGDQFIFADGTPIRFWGVNIVAGNVFMPHEQAERTAARLARFGCNMVRLHHMDADWAHPNIFDNSFDDTQHFSADSLDRLDYLVSQLKQRGIYIYLDLLVHRKFKAGDGVRDWAQVDNGAKIVAHYDPRIIALQKQYAHDLYTHRNPYTGLRYCDDPVIAMSEIINESSLFWEGGYGRVPASYLTELDDRYRQWAAQQGASLPESASVVAGLQQRDAQALRFLYETQVAYFTQMRDYLRSIGVKVPLAGSNFWEDMALDIQSNLVMDYVDRHGYWDHPQGGYGPDSRFNGTPMVKSLQWNLPSAFATQRAAGKPFIVTEWNCCWINEFVAEGPLLMAAYGAYQDWGGALQFDYAGGDWSDRISGTFDLGDKPHVLATWPAAARLFLAKHVRPGATVEHALAFEDVAQGAAVHEGLPGQAGLRHRIAFRVAAEGEAAVTTIRAEAPGPAAADTGQLQWNGEAGLVTVDAPQTAGRIGFAAAPVQVGPVTFDLSPEFAVVTVTALDGRALGASEHLLITATARAENSGMVYVETKRSARDPGHAPILMEPVRGTVRIAIAKPVRAAAAYALDSVGERMGHVDVAREDGAVGVALTADAFWYEVVLAR
jgi:hypothetical protein